MREIAENAGNVLAIAPFPALPAFLAFAAFLIRFDGPIDLPGSLGHEKSGNRVPPLGVMSSASVGLDSLFIAIELEQHEPARIVDLLNDVESNYARLFPTVSGVLFRFRNELV
jgi:hypothetical protein